MDIFFTSVWLLSRRDENSRAHRDLFAINYSGGVYFPTAADDLAASRDGKS